MAVLPPPLHGSADDQRERARLLDDEEVDELEAEGKRQETAAEATRLSG